MESKAITKYVRLTTKKARYILDTIRGKRVDDALRILKFTEKRGAYFIRKTLESALANAQTKADQSGSDLENLKVKTAMASEGPTLKRFLPRAMGRASRIRKRTSHISIVLSDTE